MSVTWADVVALDSALSEVSVGAQHSILATAEARTPEAVWGTRRSDAIMYLAAHLGQLVIRGGGGAGPVVSESVGQVARTYAQPSSMSKGSLESTTWGREYQQLLRTLPAARIGVAF